LLIAAFTCAAALLPAERGRACDPVTNTPFALDPAQVGVDQTPPALGQPTVVEVRHDDNGEGCVTPKCGWDNSVSIRNLATDDTTPPDRIGYRLKAIAGSAPPGLNTGDGAILAWGDTLWLYFDGDGDVDFTLEIVALDAAGNESEPRTVRIHNDTGGCRIGRGALDGRLTPAIVGLALAAALRRRRRRPRLP
jgi:hypothetical protein